MRKYKKVIYRFWHNQSAKGLVGYIGKDSYHPKRYSIKARVSCSKNTKLYNALKKYPVELWHREVLASGFETTEELNAAEIFFIAKFDSMNRGYNCSAGGEGGDNVKCWEPENPGEIIRRYTVEELSLKALGKIYGVSEATIQSFLHRNNIETRTLSQAMQIRFRNHRAPMYGRKMSAATRKLMRDNSSRAWRPESPEYVIKLYQQYRSIIDIGKMYNVAPNTVKRFLTSVGVVLRPARRYFDSDKRQQIV
jgi:hypothetical protein